MQQRDTIQLNSALVSLGEGQMRLQEQKRNKDIADL